MNAEKFFTQMYFDIWQSNDISKLDYYYAKDFKEILDTTGDNKEPIEFSVNYDGIIKSALFQKENYKDTTFEIKKLVASDDNCISVHFYSSSIDKRTNELKHRCVCGIWQLNDENKINHVWAVVTPYYPE